MPHMVLANNKIEIGMGGGRFNPKKANPIVHKLLITCDDVLGELSQYISGLHRSNISSDRYLGNVEPFAAKPDHQRGR